MHVAKLCPRASLYSYFQHPANLSTPACTHISNTRPTCQPQLGQLVCRSHPLLLSPRLGIFRSPRSLPRCVPHWEALRERGSTGGFPHVNSNDSRFLLLFWAGAGGKGKRGWFTQSAKRVFSNKPAGGPTSLLHLAVPPPPPLCCSPFGNFVSFAFGLRLSLS